MNILRDSLMALVKSKRVWLLQFVANPVLMAIAALWLLIPEAQTWQVVLTVIAVLGIALGFLWLHAATFAYFATFHAGETTKFRESFQVKNLVGFLVWAAVFAFLLHFVHHVTGEFQPQLASYFRSISPAWLRRMISQERMDSLVALKFWVLFWIVVPGLVLPFVAQAARGGFGASTNDGRRGWRKTVGSRVYWGTLIVLVIVGVYVPQVLVEWLPKVSSVNEETLSLVLRLFVAWLLTASAWTLLASLLGRLGNAGNPGRGRDIVG